MKMAFLLYTLLRLLFFPSPLSKWEARLNSDVYREREAASVALLKQDSLQLCRDLARSRYPEVRRRAILVYQVKRTHALKSLEPYPCLDALWYDCSKKNYRDCWCKRRLYRYIDRYNFSHPASPPLWPAYREATRDWTSDRIDAGCPLLFMQVIHREMHRRDKAANCSYPKK